MSLLILASSLSALEYELVTFANGKQLYRPRGAIVRRTEEPKIEEPQCLFDEYSICIITNEPESETKESEPAKKPD